MILSIEVPIQIMRYWFYSYSVFSENDHSYLKLAAGKSVLQLATRWDSHISPELFRNTLLIARVLSIFYTANWYLASDFIQRPHFCPLTFQNYLLWFLGLWFWGAIFSVDAYDCVLASACLARSVWLTIIIVKRPLYYYIDWIIVPYSNLLLEVLCILVFITSAFVMYILFGFQDPSYNVRKSFICKLYGLLKKRAIPFRYACAFALTSTDCSRDIRTEVNVLFSFWFWLVFIYMPFNLHVLKAFPCTVPSRQVT